MIELVGLGAQVADDVAQALQAAQLSQAEGDELRPAAHHAEGRIPDFPEQCVGKDGL